MKRNYTIELNQDGTPIEAHLRIDLNAQLRMKKKYNENALSTIFTALDDIEKMLFVFNEALNWKGNDNTITDAAELYELICDNDLGGVSGFQKILTGIARESGLINEKEKAVIDAQGEGLFEDAAKNVELLSTSTK